jgi:hypothetical protein
LRMAEEEGGGGLGRRVELQKRGGGGGIRQQSGAVEAGVALVNRAACDVVRYGAEVGGAWAGVGVVGRHGKKRNRPSPKRIIFFYLFKKVLKELNGFDQKGSFPILINFK